MTSTTQKTTQTPYIRVEGVHPVCETNLSWDGIWYAGKQEEERTAEFVTSDKSAAERLAKVQEGKGGAGGRTVDGKKEIKVRVGPWMAFKMLFKGYISPVDQLRFKHVLADYDDPAEIEETTTVVEERGEQVRKPRHSNANWWASYSLLAHAKHHSPTFTRANEMIVSAWIQKRMEADGVRSIQIAKVLPLAVRMAFVPTEGDVDARMIDNAPAVIRRHKKKDTKYWSSFFGLRRNHYESG